MPPYRGNVARLALGVLAGLGLLVFLNLPRTMLDSGLDRSHLQQQQRDHVLHQRQVAATPPPPPPTPPQTFQVIEEHGDGDWLDYLYSLANKPEPPAAAEATKGVLVIAHCYYKQAQRTYDPLGQSLWFSRFIGEHLGEDASAYKIEYRKVVALPAHLPNSSIDPTSRLGLILLGLSPDVHIRVCSFGSTQIMNTLTSVPGVKQTAFTPHELQHTLRNLSLWWDDVPPGEVPPSQRQQWSHDAMIYWPARGSRTTKITIPTLNGQPFGPFIPRFNKEPWFESVPGVSVQFDTKRTLLSIDSLTVYYPMILDTMSWRLTGSEFPNHWSDRVGFLPPHVTTIKQALTRPAGWQAPTTAKPYFATFVNSHCAGPGAHLLSVVVRELFVYATHQRSHRAVNILGSCPLRGVDRARAGPQDAQAKQDLRHKSALAAMRSHRFAIVFENGRTSGYVSEKIVNAYLAEAVPVYFGAYGEQVERMLNSKAFVHCNLPNNLTELGSLQRMQRAVCGGGGGEDQPPPLAVKSDECHERFSRALERDLEPFFAPCIDAMVKIDEDAARYERMLREPLIHLDGADADGDGEPTGIFSGRTYGRVTHVLMRAFGYRLDV